MEKGEAEQESYVCPFIPELIILIGLSKRRLYFWQRWFVCLSVCGQHYSKSYEQIWMNGFG